MTSDVLTAGSPSFPLPGSVLRSLPARDLDPLVDEERRSQILAIADQFPVPVQTACYECRLSATDPRVDLALCVFVVPGLADAAEGACGRLESLDPRWNGVARFVREWSRPRDLVSAQIPFVWFAFDLPSGVAAVPIPCLGLCVDPGFLARRLGLDVPADEAAAGRVNDTAQWSYRLLHGEPMPQRVRDLLQQCLVGVEAKHLSLMVGRSPPTFKLDVRLLAADVGDYLRRIGWPEAPDDIQRQVSALVPWGGHVQLNLVLHPEMAPPLEVEFLTTPGEASRANRAAFLRALVGAELCGAAKAQVLASCLAQTLILGGPDQPESALGRSWYVKVRFQRGRATEAKAYLGLMPRVGREFGVYSRNLG